MDIWGRYKSALGYRTNNGGIDSYGVDHSNFSLRDEIAYQTARENRERQMIQSYNNQGITCDYPQAGTNFWGGLPENNYGFGNSNIESNIGNITTKLNNQPNFISNSTTNNVWQNIKNGTAVVTDTIRYAPEETWKKIESLGELAADTKLAYDYWQKMNETGKTLVKTFGTGQGADIDNYYHPLLQCELAKISPTSRDWGLRLGYAKEIWDYHKKKGQMPIPEISTDMQKDLHNNLYGSNLGYYNPNKSCWEMLDERRTPNMRKANIR